MPDGASEHPGDSLFIHRQRPRDDHRLVNEGAATEIADQQHEVSVATERLTLGRLGIAGTVLSTRTVSKPCAVTVGDSGQLRHIGPARSSSHGSF